MRQSKPASGAMFQPKPAAGALIQRTQASRPFLARFMGSTKQHAGAPSTAVDEIQEVKEELYDMISVTENSAHTDACNMRLLMLLSAQIKPRPDDPQWRSVRASKTKSHVLRAAGIVAGLCLGFLSFLLLEGLEEVKKKKERQEVDGANEKEVTTLV